jgi:hypothetical protein
MHVASRSLVDNTESVKRSEGGSQYRRNLPLADATLCGSEFRRKTGRRQHFPIKPEAINTKFSQVINWSLVSRWQVYPTPEPAYGMLCSWRPAFKSIVDGVSRGLSASITELVCNEESGDESNLLSSLSFEMRDL